MAPPIAGNWQAQILKGVGAPVTPQNLLFVNDWARAEGGSAANNPFNTTQGAPGASSYNSVGVRNYGSPQQGIQATVQTLQNGRYGPIIQALQQGSSARSAAQALASSPWGTGSLVLKMLGGGGGGQSGAPAGLPVRQQPASPQANPHLLQILLATRQAVGLPAPGQAVTRALQARLQPQPQPQVQPQTGQAAAAAPARNGRLAELLLEGTGGPTHSTGPHVHVASTNPQTMLQLLQLGRSLGLTELENPYVDSVNPSVHAKNSFHDRTFPGLYNGRRLGEATDFSGPAMQRFYHLVQQRFGAPSG